MAYIQRREHLSGAVTYRARIRLKGAPEMSDSFPSQKKALAWASRMEAEIKAGRYFGREEHKERTFGEFINYYLEKELPKNTDASVKLRLHLNWWKKHLKDYFLCHITPPMIARFKDKLL